VANCKASDVKTAGMPNASCTRREELLKVASADQKDIANSRAYWDSLEGSKQCNKRYIRPADRKADSFFCSQARPYGIAVCEWKVDCNCRTA
jgi:hypothetical protein